MYEYEERIITWNTGDNMEQSRFSLCYECYPSKNPKIIQPYFPNYLFYVPTLKANKYDIFARKKYKEAKTVEK